MKKNKIIFIVAVFITLLSVFNSCKKYPEDKFISLRKPTNRLVGNWKIKEYTFNGNDVIDVINAQTKTFDLRDLELEINKKDGKIEQQYRFKPYNYLNVDGRLMPLNSFTKYNTFFFQSSSNGNKTGDSLFSYIFTTPLNYKGSKYSIPWDIKKLYLSKMHLQLKTDSGTYHIHFEKK